MIDTTTEHIVSLTEAAQSVPPRGVHASTCYRWVYRGIRGVRLESIFIGGSRMTSLEALARFFDATTATANGQPAPTSTPRQREKAIDAAERELASEFGI